jgi:signal transduction histidine kinase
VTEPDDVPTVPPDAPVPGLHRLRLDVLLQELVNRAQEIIGVEHKLHHLLDAVVAVASEQTLPDTLRRITELSAELSDAQYAALGVIGPDLKLVEFITVGLDPHDRAAIGEPPSGKGILGLLITDPESIRIPDLGQHSASFGFPANHPPMGSFLGVPIRVRNEVFGNLYLTEKRGGGQFTEQDEDLMTALAAAAGIAIENARLGEETRLREIGLAAASEVTNSLLRGAPAADTTQLVVDKAAGIVGADAAVLLLRDDETDELTVLAAHGPLAVHSVHQRYTLTDSLQFFVDGEPRPFGSGTHMLQAVSSSAPFADFSGPGVLVPLGSGGRIIGVLAVVRHPSGAPFRADDIRMVHTFAGHAALTVEFSRASADRQRLAIYQDRDRIARDLHDLIIQRLFAIGLGLQGVLPKVGQPNVTLTLSTFVDDLDQTIHDVRKTIFSLQEPDDRPSGLRGHIVRTVSATAQILSFEPLLTMAGPLDSAVPDRLRPDLLAVLGEALTNVAKHAGGTMASVAVSVDTAARTLTTVIEDDGAGPSPDDRPGHGTANMAHRARRLGGWFTLDPRPTGGARVTWCVPLDGPG